MKALKGKGWPNLKELEVIAIELVERYFSYDNVPDDVRDSFLNEVEKAYIESINKEGLDFEDKQEETRGPSGPRAGDPGK